MKSVFMRYPGGKFKAVTFSYDDGPQQDERLAALFDKYHLKATFNLNSDAAHKFRFTAEQIHDIFLSKGHEVAVHGEFHRANGNIRAIEGIRDILNCRLELEKKCGGIIRGMAYPDTGIRQMGSFISYEQIRQYVQELDIAYARTVGGDNDAFQLPQDFYAWVPSAHHDNPEIMTYIDKFLALDISTMYHAWHTSRLLYIWGHSFELDRHDNWEHMEQICQKIAHHDDIWYATNIEICDYVNAYKALRYSADGSLVYNPTLITMWLDAYGKLYTIAPGEAVRIG